MTTRAYFTASAGTLLIYTTNSSNGYLVNAHYTIMAIRKDKVMSLKGLAAEAVPLDTSLVNLPIDITKLLEHYRTIITTCEHNTTWSYRRGQVHGVVMYACGCEEEWSRSKREHYNVTCRKWTCVGYGVCNKRQECAGKLEWED